MMIVETARGVECGEVVQGVREIADAAVPKALKPITRMADSVDIRRMRHEPRGRKTRLPHLSGVASSATGWR